jgi:hypothetical protein
VKDAELKWWHVRWRLAGRVILRFAILSGKILGPLCLLAALACGIFYLLQPWLTARRLALDPRLSIVPIDLPVTGQGPLSAGTVDCQGFTFRLPREVTRTFPSKSLAMVHLGYGGMLTCQNLSRFPGILEGVASEKLFRKVLGPEALRSKFSLMQAALLATPAQVKWWRFRSWKNEKVDYLLTAKSMTLWQLHSFHSSKIRSIYKVAFGEFKGFQIGDPDVAPYDARVDLFDAEDHHLAFEVIGPEDHGRLLTQTEINAIVESIQTAPDH